MDLCNPIAAVAVGSRKKEIPPHLPEDLIHLILTRLPSKAVLRFRSVNKLWYTLISNPRFTRHHQIIASRRNPITFIAAFPIPLSTLVWIDIDRYASSIRVDRETYDRSSIREFTCKPRIVTDSCYGVLCVTSGRTVAFWNPAIREVRVVDLYWMNHTLFIGFGCLKDVKGNVVDFKLLSMLPSNEELDGVVDFVVYSLRSNSSSSIDHPSFPIKCFMHFASVYLNGTLYWLAKGGEEGSKEAYILTFDLVSHAFGQIDLPPRICEINIQDRNSNFLTVIDDQYLSFGLVDRGSECLDLWVLCEIDGRRLWVSRERIGPLMNTGLMLKYSDSIGGVIAQIDLEGRFGYHHVGDNASKHETGLYGFTEWIAYSESLISLKRIANGQQDNLEDND